MNKKGEINTAMAIGLLCVVVGSVVLGAFMVLAFNEPQVKIMYKLSDGVLCERYIGNFGNLRFYDCSDGNTYINPETYRKVIIK